MLAARTRVGCLHSSLHKQLNAPSRVRQCSRHRLQCQAVLEPSVAEAVTQQATAFAIVLAGEALFSRSNIPESDKGRPEVVPVAAGVGAALAASVLVGQGGGGFLPAVGLVLGLVGSGAMVYYNVQRFQNLQYNDGDWPGPKAWPGGMGLISFFAVNVFFQALVAEVTTSI